MTIFTYLFFAILTLISSLLDISYFSALPVFGSSILLTFQLIIVIAAYDWRYYSIIFAAFAILFYTGLSSLPIYFILILFIGIPLLIFYLRKRIIFELNYFTFLTIIFASNLVFQIAYLIIGWDFSINIIFAALSFILINSLAGIILFIISSKFAQTLKIRKN